MSIDPRSILEVGCNLGLNQRALQQLTDAELFAVEPNDSARQTVLSDGVMDEAHIEGGGVNSVMRHICAKYGLGREDVEAEFDNIAETV